jgi:hypothetical protein
MKTTIIAILFFLLPSIAISGMTIPTEAQVILKTPADFPGGWTPTPLQTNKAVAGILEFLEKPENFLDGHFDLPGMDKKREAEEIRKIAENLSNFRVQFIGITRNGKKKIYCNFFPSSGHFQYWKRKFVFVLDGGHSFWQIECDPNTGNVLNYTHNGYA